MKNYKLSSDQLKEIAPGYGGCIASDMITVDGHCSGKESLTPMHKDINTYHSGEWGQMEKQWAKHLDHGGNVHAKIEPVYSDGTMKATRFNITETINGIANERVIDNPGL